MTAAAPQDRVDALLNFIALEEPDRDTTAKAVTWRLRHAAHYVDTEVRKRLSPQGIELWEIEILSALLRRGGVLTMGELLDVAQLTSGAITNRIGQLERKGFVLRAINPEDRRQINVSLTPHGHTRVREVIAANSAAEDEIFTALPTELQSSLSASLREFLLATEGADPYV